MVSVPTACTAVLLVCPLIAAVAAERMLYSFAGGDNGATPSGTLPRDAAGGSFGVTISGGDGGCATSLSGGCGTAFELTPSRDA